MDGLLRTGDQIKQYLKNFDKEIEKIKLKLK